MTENIVVNTLELNDDPSGAALRAWATGGRSGAADKLAAERRGFHWSDRECVLRFEKRSLAADLDTKGGYTISSALANTYDVAQRQTNPLRSVATILTDDVPGEQYVPTANDAAEGQLLDHDEAEVNVASGEVFGRVTFQPRVFTSKIFKVSRRLLESSPIAELIVGEMMGSRIGRIQGRYFTTGDGVSKPLGFVNGGTAYAAESASVITVDDLWNLVFATPVEYRARGTFMAHSSIVKLLCKERADGQFVIDWKDGRAPKLLGFPLVTNDYMASAVASGAKTVAFGAFDRFFIREGVAKLTRYDQLYAETAEVGFQVQQYGDGALVDAGLGCVQVLTH